MLCTIKKKPEPQFIFKKVANKSFVFCVLSVHTSSFLLECNTIRDTISVERKHNFFFITFPLFKGKRNDMKSNCVLKRY